jgi:hypothetical protein
MLTRAAELSSYDFLSADESDEAQQLLESLRAEVVRLVAQSDKLEAMEGAAAHGRDIARARLADVEADRDTRLASAIRGQQRAEEQVRDLLVRVVAAEAERDAARADRDAADCAASEYQRQLLAAQDAIAAERAATERWMDRATEFLGAHQDAQAMLEEVAAERDELDDGANLLERARGLCKENERLRCQLSNYESNHGARCDAEQERYATIAESACRMLSTVASQIDRVGLPGYTDRTFPALAEICGSISAFLSAPGHEVPGLRAKLAARDSALDACAARISGLLAVQRALPAFAGALADLDNGTLSFGTRRKLRCIVEALRVLASVAVSGSQERSGEAVITEKR